MTLFGRYNCGPLTDPSRMEASLLALWFRLEVKAALDHRF